MRKCLNDDPATAKLLKQIYGGTRPDISYPKVNTVPRANLPPAFLRGGRGEPRDGGALTDAKTSKEVKVPKFRGTRPEGPAPIDSVMMRRKRGSKIKEEQAVDRIKMEHYRPPYVKPVGEGEKSRLAEKFEFGGGKALPNEMTCPSMPTPSKERWKKSEAQRVDGTLRRRKGGPDKYFEFEEGVRKKENIRALATNMFDQVANEIEERQKFLFEARESGFPYEDEGRILGEISQRMTELTRLTPPA